MNLETYRNNWLRENALMRAQQATFEKRPPANKLWHFLRTTVWVLGLLLAILFISTLLLTAIPAFDGYSIYLELETVSSIFWFLVVIAHFVIQFRTIAMATGSLSRERERNTWDLLIMTGISTKAIIRGKWWAVVRQQFPSYLWLGVLRASAILWYGFAITSSLRGYGYSNLADFQMIYPRPLQTIFGVGIIMLLTLLNLGFTAACGLAGAALGEKTSVALSRGISLRTLLGLLPLVIIGLAFGSLGWLLRDMRDVANSILSVSHLVLNEGIILLDNGATMASFLSQVVVVDVNDINRFNSFANILDSVVALLLAVPVYWLYTTLALRWAERRLKKLGTLEE